MENRRPDLLDLRSDSQTSVARPLRSPRLHVAGEVPPELSPLDAFAMQSRLLAKQLEDECSRSGRRMSRLPPLTLDSPLVVQGRSDYFRSMSQDSASERGGSPAPSGTGLGLRTEVEEAPIERPRSVHPRMSRIPPTPDETIPLPKRPIEDILRGRQLGDAFPGDTFFGGRRELSPVPLERAISSGSERGRSPLARTASQDGPQDGQPSQPPPSSPHSSVCSPEKGTMKGSFDPAGLFPPRSGFPQRSSSIMSAPLESTHDDGSNPPMSPTSLPRHGGLTGSNFIASPAPSSYRRSPSISSEVSGLRPSYNFSRPLARTGTPILDPPARQASSDSQASFALVDDTAHTPISMSSEGFPDVVTDDGKSPVSPYNHARYTLPRGKALQRSSPGPPDNQLSAAYQWEQLISLPTNMPRPLVEGQPPPSPPTRPSSSAGPKLCEEPIPRPSLERSKLGAEVADEQPSPDPRRLSTDGTSHHPPEDALGAGGPAPAQHEPENGSALASAATSDSPGATVEPPKADAELPSLPPALTAEERVTKGIALHENGSLSESTYHLRHAAKLGHPTGMLLYALACRHGWGMRPNQREGAEWLRKAAESVSLEIADDEDSLREGRAVDMVGSRTRKAQFALSIYELGVSYMKGWGVEQDKSLALRCYEIAGSWGDVDALAEAGFCYAQGIGCKKDLKRSAGFYRQAEAKGMSMIGNSWIHKPKYNDDAPQSPKSGMRPRSKSKPRKHIFGIKPSS